MSGWQQTILNKLSFDEPICYLINDPDALCTEPVILETLQNSLATLHAYEEPLALRLAYEQWCEQAADKQSGAFIITLGQSYDEHLPWDIEHNSRALDFHISTIIPEVEAEVLRQLPSALYDTIRAAIDIYRPGKMNGNNSLGFVLRHVFKIAPEIIQSDVDLVRLLIRKHYLNMEMADTVEHYLITTLRHNKAFGSWPLEQLITDKSSFFGFLQQQWQFFLKAEVASSKERGHASELVVPFNDQDVRVFINDLFAEGYLKLVTFDQLPAAHWAQIGVLSEDGDERYQQFQSLLDRLTARLNEISRQTKPCSSDWGTIGHDLGRLKALSYDLTLNPEEQTALSTLANGLEQIFHSWMLTSYGTLLNEPTIKSPVMVHRVAPWLHQRFVNEKRRVCLLVMDGMGFQQWSVIRQYLQESTSLTIDDRHCFAWVPSITSISRQALFAGKAPFYFARDLLTTGNEGNHWHSFWKEAGLTGREVNYQKKLETLADHEFSTLVKNRRIQVMGLVVNFIDEQLHGMQAGMAGLNAVLKVWLQQWTFAKKLQTLVNEGFDIVITADHGSQECVGMGRLADGVSAETKGERVRIYQHKSLRAKAATSATEPVIEWPPSRSALPPNVFPLISDFNSAFVSKGKTLIGHGGISLHEIVVPLAVISKKN